MFGQVGLWNSSEQLLLEKLPALYFETDLDVELLLLLKWLIGTAVVTVVFSM